MAEAVYVCLQELGLECKLLTITGDNASNNETLIKELYSCLAAKHHTITDELENNREVMRFTGLKSYVCCLAHILNLIVKDILTSLKAGENSTASLACDDLQAGIALTSGAYSIIEKIWVLALWVGKNPQQRQMWRKVCRMHELSAKMIEYDVTNRWNYTYRMLKDAVTAERQMKEYIMLYINLQSLLLSPID